jgi:TolA-binding protein
LKAKHFTIEQEIRVKLKNVQKDHENKVEQMQIKIKSLQKEVAGLSKGRNRILANTKELAGSGSGTDSPSLA